MSYKILGLDPGSLKFGFALTKFEGKSINILTSGFLDLRKQDNFFKRLSMIHNFFNNFITSYGSDYSVSVESLIHVKNVSSLAKLSQARGAALSVLGSEGCAVSEYAPNLVKSAVSGHGFASKDSVAKSLSFLFPQHKFSSDDESDALALALCHSLYRGKEVSGISKSKRTSKGSNLKSSLKHLL